MTVLASGIRPGSPPWRAHAILDRTSVSHSAGLAQIGRGIVLLGVATEEDKKKALETWAAFEAGVQTFQGITAVSPFYRNIPCRTD